MIDLILTGLIVTAAVEGYRRGAVFGLFGLVVVALSIGLGMLISNAAGRDIGMFVMFFLGGGCALVLAVKRHAIIDWIDEELGESAREFDRPLGAIVHVGVVVALAWFLGAVLTFTPQREGAVGAIRESRIIRALVTTVNPTGPIATMILRSGLVPALDGPVILVDEPDSSIVDASGVQRAQASVVRVLGEACGEVASGTGWVVAQDLIVTNAHVIAGHRQTRVALRPKAPGIPVTVVAVDPHNDLAILRLPNLALQPLARVSDLHHGDPVAVIGYPEEFQRTITPARFDRIIEFALQDIYESGTRLTQLAVFRGSVLSGNSGSPLLNSDGAVVATVTSSAVHSSIDGGYGAPNSALDSLLLHAGTQAVSSGQCLENHGARVMGEQGS